MNTLANMGAAFFLLAFAFLEKEPTFMCQLDKGSHEWTRSSISNPLEDEYCSGKYNCKIDWEDA